MMNEQDSNLEINLLTERAREDPIASPKPINHIKVITGIILLTIILFAGGGYAFSLFFQELDTQISVEEIDTLISANDPNNQTEPKATGTTAPISNITASNTDVATTETSAITDAGVDGTTMTSSQTELGAAGKQIEEEQVVKAVPKSGYVLPKNTPYVASEYVPGMGAIELPSVPSGLYIDEELGYELSLPSIFEEYSVKKTRYPSILSYGTKFSVDTEKVEWFDEPFPVFKIESQQIDLWDEGGRTLTDDNRLILTEDLILTGKLYLAHDDKYVYTIAPDKILCPSKYKKEYQNEPKPTPHCEVYDVVDTDIAKSFRLHSQ
jgi:hypothetical protein